MHILTGILLGLSTLIFIGPVFFYLLKSSLESGFKAGVAIAIGIIVGDVICVLLAVYGFGKFFESPENQKIFAGIGGVLLLLFGLKYIFKPNSKESKTKLNNSKSIFIYGINGFLINFINPFVFAIWFGFYTLNLVKYKDYNDVIISLIFTLLVIFVSDVLKAYFSNKISAKLNQKKLIFTYKIFGVIMVLFSIRLFVFLF